MKSSIFHNILVVAFVLIGQNIAAQKILSLEEAVALARENNADIKAANIEGKVSRQERNVARSLFLPTISLNGQINHYFKRNPFFGFGSEVSQDKIPYGRFGGEDQLVGALNAIQPLYNPIAGPTLKQANLSNSESELRARLTTIQVVAAVRETYLQILVLQERLDLQNESIRRNQLVLRDARALFVQGKALRVDTLRAYTAIKNLEPQILKLKSAIESSKLHLNTLLGLETGDVTLSDSLTIQLPPTPIEEDQIYETALRDNPELQLLRLGVEIGRQHVSISSASRLPVVAAVAQYQLQSQTNDFAFRDAYYPSSSFAGIHLSVPLFTGFSTQSKTQAARLRLEQVELREQYAREQLRTRVHEITSSNRESLQRLETALSVTETATLSYNIVQYRYQKGIASRLELTDAELELNTAKSNYLEAVYDYLSSEIELSKLIGNID